MPKKFKSNFSLGGVMAENDPLLSNAYWDNGDFASMESFQDSRCFVIGRTGSGKSAAFRHLEERHAGRVIRIAPENLSLPYITNLNVMRYLLELEVHLEPLFKALWKHIIIVEIIKHRYKITTPEQKTNIVRALLDKFSRDEGKRKAIAYLEEFGDKFWCEADERVRQIAEGFEHKIDREGSIAADLKALSGGGSSAMSESVRYDVKRELNAKYQKLVNDTQLPRLNEMVSILSNEILESEQHRTFLVVDDLDKDWVDEKLSNILIQCLLETVVDMQRVSHLKILVALRTNIFDQLGRGIQNNKVQMEKIRGSSLLIKWTENDLRNLLDQRVDAASRMYEVDHLGGIKDILPKNKKHNVGALEYILGRTLMRPRDAILYMNSCLREATGESRISWDNIKKSEKRYSIERLEALYDEWKDPYVGINRVFDLFRGHSYRMGKPEIQEIVGYIALLPSENDFLGAEWVIEMTRDIYSADYASKQWRDLYGKTLDILFKISFLGLVLPNQEQIMYSYSNDSYVITKLDFENAVGYEIHPAFRQGLDCKEPTP